VGDEQPQLSTQQPLHPSAWPRFEMHAPVLPLVTLHHAAPACCSQVERELSIMEAMLRGVGSQQRLWHPCLMRLLAAVRHGAGLLFVFVDEGMCLWNLAWAACHWPVSLAAAPLPNRFHTTWNALVLTPALLDMAAGLEEVNRLVGVQGVGRCCHAWLVLCCWCPCEDGNLRL